VADELGQGMVLVNQPLLGTQLQGSMFRSDFLFRSQIQIGIRNVFSTTQVEQKLRSAFKEQKLDNINFEFGVTNVNSEVEMSSRGFEKSYQDTVTNQQLVCTHASVWIVGLFFYQVDVGRCNPFHVSDIDSILCHHPGAVESEKNQ
jgi:hypothetical protein